MLQYVGVINDSKNIKLSNFVPNIIESLLSAIEAKDIWLRKHSENVAKIAKEIAIRLNLPIGEVINIYFAALLHDIGKIGITDTILNKPGRLSDKEYNCIKRHSAIGAKIVNRIKEFKPFVNYIKYHHERYDGIGYPNNLKGEDIPLGARILAVADAFDAMVSKRVYRKTVSIKKAIEEIKGCSGTQFDPIVVRAFLESAGNLFEEQDVILLTAN